MERSYAALERKSWSLTLSLQPIGWIQFAENGVFDAQLDCSHGSDFAVSAVMLATNEWQTDPERGLAASGFGGDRSMVSFDDRVDNGKAQAISGAAVRGVLRADESVE